MTVVRRPRSTCIIMMQFQPISKANQKRFVKDFPPNSLGVVTIRFPRGGKIVYTLNKKFRFADYIAWSRASSPGKVWNRKYIGRV